MSDQYPPQNPSGQQPGGNDPQYGQAPQYGQSPQYGQAPQYGAPVPTGPDGEPPLWAPWYGIPFGKAVSRFFKKYATFSGRASRSEFWYWTLANAIVSIILGAIYLIGAVASARQTVDTGYGTASVMTSPSPLFIIGGILLGLWGLATIVPSLALGWRRLHDANLAGALWIIALFIGIVGIIFGLLPSNPQGAQYDRPDSGR